VRSYRGRDGAWYRHATARPAGAIRTAGQQADVTFTPIDLHQRDLLEAIGDAYRAKYGRYGDRYLQPMLATKPSPPPWDSSREPDAVATPPTRRERNPS
jgi:hypothetical protein